MSEPPYGNLSARASRTNLADDDLNIEGEEENVDESEFGSGNTGIPHSRGVGDKAGVILVRDFARTYPKMAHDILDYVSPFIRASTMSLSLSPNSSSTAYQPQYSQCLNQPDHWETRWIK
jgi:hypothetical protein